MILPVLQAAALSCPQQASPSVSAVVSVYRECSSARCAPPRQPTERGNHTGVGFFLSLGPSSSGRTYLITALHVVKPKGEHLLAANLRVAYARTSCVRRPERKPEWAWEAMLESDSLPFVESGPERNAFYDPSGDIDLVAIRYSPPEAWSAFIVSKESVAASRDCKRGAPVASRVPFRWSEGDNGQIESSALYEGKVLFRGVFRFEPHDGNWVRTEFLIGSMVPKHSDSGAPVFLVGADPARPRLAGVIVGKLADAVTIQGTKFLGEPAVLLPAARALELVGRAESAHGKGVRP